MHHFWRHFPTKSKPALEQEKIHLVCLQTDKNSPCLRKRRHHPTKKRGLHHHRAKKRVSTASNENDQNLTPTIPMPNPLGYHRTPFPGFDSLKHGKKETPFSDVVDGRKPPFVEYSWQHDNDVGGISTVLKWRHLRALRNQCSPERNQDKLIKGFRSWAYHVFATPPYRNQVTFRLGFLPHRWESQSMFNQTAQYHSRVKQWRVFISSANAKASTTPGSVGRW